MQLAVNYSPQAEALRREGRIEIDLYKCPDWPDLINQAREVRPIYVHFPLNTGSLGEVDWDQAERMLADTGTPFVNLHLIARPEQFPEGLDSERIADALVADVHTVIRRFGAERVMVENVIYRGAGDSRMLRAVVEPAVIGRVLEETGCGLLLDTAHAWITAESLRMDPREYVSQLPVHRLREWHITGTQHDGTRWRDHMPLRAEDWDLAEWVAEQIAAGEWAKPWVASLEYGGIGPLFEWRSDATVIAEQVPRLFHLVHSIG